MMFPQYIGSQVRPEYLRSTPIFFAGTNKNNGVPPEIRQKKVQIPGDLRLTAADSAHFRLTFRSLALSES